MKRILCISTGGTFNKVYNPLEGKLIIDPESHAVRTIMQKWQYECELVSVIGKDSLEMDNSDRLVLLATINLSDYDDVLIVHGTDTMELSADYLAKAELEKRIVMTGAMIPFAVDTVDAVANFASAYGFLQQLQEDGVYIAMNGIIDHYERVTKNRKLGKFVYKPGA
jgi:L-asparaginase